jgi:hypothetical protein
MGVAMRGDDEISGSLFSYIDLEQRVRIDHPLRAIREIANAALETLSRDFARLYSGMGRPSIAPEKLLRAMLLQAFYSVRSERQLMERTLIEAWASMKSLKPRDSPVDTGPRGGGRNAPADFRGEKRSNATHRSTTDPDARLYRKGQGMEARLCYIGHGLMENRSGLIVDARLTRVSGHAERLAALDMMEPWAHRSRAITLGADKGYDAADFVEELRTINVRPHVAQNESGRRSAIDKRTTRHPSYAVSQRIRKRIEEAFGWIKTVAGLRQTKLRGLAKVDWAFTFATAAYNLVRAPKLIAATP